MQTTGTAGGPLFPTEESLSERLKTVGIYTAISMVLSLLITLAILYLSGYGMHRITIIISLVAPGIIAPLTTWYISDLLVRIARLEEKQRRLATYDDLTGLLSRRAFLEQSETLLKLSLRQDQKIACVMLDLDKFKSVNDQFGHGGGDQLLSEFATLVRDSLRKSDLAGRVGGEEFAIFMPGVGLHDATIFLEKLREKTENLVVGYRDKTICTTVSVGVSSSESGGHANINDLFRLSDEALYKAKSLGGNKVISAQNPFKV